jgi:cytoskeletal protein CcmA (bactofilin family)
MLAAGRCRNVTVSSILGVSVFKRRKGDDSAPDEGATMSGGFSLSEHHPHPSELKDHPNGAPADSGLGVPPFRPAPLKEAHAMARPPFTPAQPTVPPAQAGVRATFTPAVPTQRPVNHDPADRRTLVVGRGISVQGTVQDAERLVVEGTVEASMIHATELAMSPGGMFKGEIEVEDAEIAGTISGTLTARGGLIIRASGRVMGSAHCRRLQVEEGGQISGQMEMLTDGAKPEPVRVAHETAV